LKNPYKPFKSSSTPVHHSNLLLRVIKCVVGWATAPNDLYYDEDLGYVSNAPEKDGKIISTLFDQTKWGVWEAVGKIRITLHDT
jgi:hypothetical protein